MGWCSRCDVRKDEDDLIPLADSTHKLCSSCFKTYYSLIEVNNNKWEEKRLKAEKKLLTKFFKVRQSGCLGYVGFVFFIILIILLIAYGT